MIDKTARDIELGKRAQLLMHDDLLTASFEALRQEYIEAWTGTIGADTGTREWLWCKVQVIEEVKHKLTTLIANGKIAESKLKN